MDTNYSDEYLKSDCCHFDVVTLQKYGIANKTTLKELFIDFKLYKTS
jgi:hypothetical protein